jgi:predicted amidohydrolase YtcJ
MILWKNGIFHTMEKKETVYHSMATNQGLIVGFDDEICHLEFDQVIDLKKAHVYPGFVDAHMHLLGYGQMLSRPNVTGITDTSEIINHLKLLFKGQKLFVEGYFESGITKRDLNMISSDVPIVMRHNDYHSLTVNDAVLNQMGLSHPTGVLTEDDAQRAMDSFPKYTHEELKALLKTSIESLYRYGITGAHSDDLFFSNGFHDTVKVFEDVLRSTPFRAHLLIHHHVVSDYVRSQRPFLDQSKYLQLGAVKMFYDGTLSSKTALMHAPYAGTNQHGVNVNGYAQFVSYVKEARSHHLPVAIHVIGDQGLDEVIDILIAYPPTKGRLDRLIHTPWVMTSSLEKLKKLPISIDIQPQFLSSDLPWALSYLSKTPDLCFPWKTLAASGVNLAGSSDAPVEIPNPLLGIHAAVMRTSRHDGKVYFEHEKVTRFEAIQMYTIQANYNSEKSNRGLLKKGYIADLSVFKNDLLSMHPDQFLKDQVVMTVVDEVICYEKLSS